MAGLLSIGVRAMFANQAALQTVGHNIANANTPGYSRQSVVLTTPDGQFTGAGFFGKGVAVQAVERAHNEFLTKDAAAAKSLANMDATRSEQLSRLEKVFPPGQDGLGYAAGQFLNSMIDVSTRPSDPSARQVVLARASELAARFSDAGQQLASIQGGVLSDLKANVSVVNQLARQIAAANDQVARTNGTGQTPNDLLDQRDQLISKLSEYVQVSTLPAGDGTMGVFIGGGQRLVLGSDAQQLAVTQDPYDATRAGLSITESSGNRPLDDSLLTGGSITALLRFQNKDLQDAANYLGQLANGIASQVNAQQALGLDQADPPGSGAPLFSIGAPRSLPAATNARNPDGSPASEVRISITDSSQVRASSYRLSTSPSGAAGEYQLTRLSDGLNRTVHDGDAVDGFKIDFTSGAPAAGDSFLLQPVTQAAVDMKRVLDNPSGIAAASPITASTSITNTGTATVATVYAVNASLNTAQAPMSIKFGAIDPADSTRRLYTLTLADGTAMNGSWKAGQPIGNDATNEPSAAAPINLGLELSLNGVPRDGDTISIDKTLFPGTNNGNAKAFLSIQNEPFIGRTLQANGSLTGGTTINDAYAAAMSDIGARVQGAVYLSGVSTGVAAAAEQQRSGQAGVNLDEEASRLMQFQQAYQAAAKVLQTAQTLFNEVLKLSGG
jgi:flagellar hook-associated protein 1 FlgK